MPILFYFSPENPLLKAAYALKNQPTQVLIDPEIFQKAHSIGLAVVETDLGLYRRIFQELKNHPTLKFLAPSSPTYIENLGCCWLWVIALKGDPDSKLIVNGIYTKWEG